MNLFLKKILLVVGISISVFAVLFISSCSLVRSDSKYLIEKHIDTIILGHSHAACAYDDTLLENVENLAAGGESYFYTYLKLKALLQSKNQIKRIILECSNNQFSKSMEKWTFKEPKVYWHFPKFSAWADKLEHQILLKKNPRQYPELLLKSLKRNMKYIFSKSGIPKSWGGYKPIEKNINLEMLKHKKHKPRSKKLHETSLAYFKKIMELCEEFKIELILIRTPIHFSSNVLDNETEYQEFRKGLTNYQFIDFQNSKLVSDSIFSNQQHLNTKGAKIFTLELKNKIKNLE